MARVVIEQLSKVFHEAKGNRIVAVKDLALTVEDKEFLVLVGPSGCGKTTTLRLIAGLEEPTSGTIAINGTMVNHVAPRDRDVAMVFQNHALYPHMTVAENLGFGLKLRKFPRNEIIKRVTATAEVLGITELLERRPSALSGGERQRVAVGRAMVRQPGVFLFDEPLSNLDPSLRGQVGAEISRLQRRLGATMLYVTHDQDEAMAIGHRIAVMKEGAIQQVAAPRQVYDAPANSYVAGFIGSPPMNLFAGRLVMEPGGMRFQGEDVARGISLCLRRERFSQLESHAGRKMIMGLRPEYFTARSGKTAGENVIEGTVEWVVPTGPGTILHISCGGGQKVCVRAPADEGVEANQTMSLVVNVGRACFFDATTGMALVAAEVTRL